MKRILIYGDSLTYGYDPRGAFGGRYPESVRWTSVLARRLVNEWELDVIAENGKEIPETPFELEHALDAILTRLPFDVFAILLGTNDYLNMYQPDVVEVTGRMKNFLEQLRARTEMSMFAMQYLLIAPPIIHTAQDEFYAKYDTSNGIFSKAYRALAEHLGVHFADAGAWNLPPAFDGYHLSEEGNLLFADRMEEILRNLTLRTTFAEMEA